MIQEKYLLDKNGRTIAVQVPIKTYEKLVADSEELNEIKEKEIHIPEDHKKIVKQRMKLMEENPEKILNWNEAKKSLKAL